ncbi:hypothetical protein GCM10009730_59170 [Streptomyces albidochromogenes]|uniref:transposase n=1 Tax=Streptomyces albidochromogenes TaxID=329524 RepID=UPI00110F7603
MDLGQVIRRHELSDAEWEFVRLLLPESSRGRKRLDDRTALNGMVWKFPTGWPDTTCGHGTALGPRCTRFRRWALEVTFERMLQTAQVKADAAGDIDCLYRSIPPWSEPTTMLRGPGKEGSAAPGSDAPDAD